MAARAGRADIPCGCSSADFLSGVNRSRPTGNRQARLPSFFSGRGAARRGGPSVPSVSRFVHAFHGPGLGITLCYCYCSGFWYRRVYLKSSRRTKGSPAAARPRREREAAGVLVPRRSVGARAARLLARSLLRCKKTERGRIVSDEGFTDMPSLSPRSSDGANSRSLCLENAGRGGFGLRQDSFTTSRNTVEGCLLHGMDEERRWDRSKDERRPTIWCQGLALYLAASPSEQSGRRLFDRRLAESGRA